MRSSVQGVHQLGQAVRDFADGTTIRAVDEAGKPKDLSDGTGHQTVTDIYLRNEFPPPGKGQKSDQSRRHAP